MKMKNGHVLEFEQEEIGGVEVGARRWERKNGHEPRFAGGWGKMWERKGKEKLPANPRKAV